MPWLTDLATIARHTGYPVTEVDGWRTRGHGPQPEVLGIVCHHTAGPTAGGDYPSLGVVRDGRPDLEGPLSHFGIGRTGRIYVIAAGKCWHNAPSISSRHTNSASIGIEAENDGKQPWPTPQLNAYKALCAELCHTFDLPVSQVKAHREVNISKPDPHSIDMNQFRKSVAWLAWRSEGDTMPLTQADADLVATTILNRSINARGHRVKEALQGAYDNTEELVDRPATDAQALADAILTRLSPDVIAETIARALPKDLAKQVVDELTARLGNSR